MEEKGYFEDLSDKKQALIEKIDTINKSPTRPNNFHVNAVMHLIAIGLTKKQVATFLGIREERVSQVISSTGGKREVERIQAELYEKNHREMFLAMAPRAARTVKKLMTDTEQKGSVRLGAAGMILDRAYGKAVQPVEHQGSAIKDLFMALDRAKNGEIKNTSQSDEILADFKEIKPDEPPKDELDSWLDENL